METERTWVLEADFPECYPGEMHCCLVLLGYPQAARILETFYVADMDGQSGLLHKLNANTLTRAAVYKSVTPPSEARKSPWAGQQWGRNRTHWLWTDPSLHYSGPHLGMSGFEAWGPGTGWFFASDSSNHRCCNCILKSEKSSLK